MPKEAELSLNERTFTLDALREGIRVDTRALDAYRDVILIFGEDYGVADVSLGKTRVVVRVSAEVVTPFPDRKFEGVFQISTELSPIASPAFEVGRPNVTESLISRILEKTVRRSSALDTESLCLIAGQKCFAIRADVHVLVYDGNLLDASCIALIAALRHFRRPDVTVEGENVTIWDIREREPVKLSMLHYPFCITFSYFDSGNIVLLDATSAEERIREGEMVVSLNKYGEVCQIVKYGGVTVDAASLFAWTKMAAERVKILDMLVTEKLADDERARDVGGLIAELRAENER